MIMMMMAVILEGAEHASSGGFVDFADPRLWVFFSLLILIVVVIWAKTPALLTKSLDERADAIRAELDEARRLREEAQELLASYVRRQREAEAEAEEIVAQAKHEADLYAKESRAQMEENLHRRAEAATRKIEQAEKQATDMVRAKAADLATQIAHTALQDNMSKTVQNKEINDSITQLREQL